MKAKYIGVSRANDGDVLIEWVSKDTDRGELTYVSERDAMHLSQDIDDLMEEGPSHESVKARFDPKKHGGG